MKVRAWVALGPGEPIVEQWRDEHPGRGEVLVEVAGCGVCHTDLGFYFDAVPTRHPFPLALGHEISGRVVAVGEGVDGAWSGREVVIPAVIPCGTCGACREGRGAVCPEQIFPGNDVHGGFASHVRVPARGLCPVPDLADAKVNPAGLELADLAVLADAITTPFQAIHRSGLRPGDLAVFVGVGGVGGFGVQIAAARGAHVVAIDVDEGRLALMREHGAALALHAGDLDFKSLRQQVRAFADEHQVPTWRRFIFETSGTSNGQTTAFGLLERGGYLSVVGFTASKIELRLSNVMAFDATVQGNWGCEPEHYGAALELVLAQRVALRPFVERRPLASINETFHDLHEHRIARRVVLIPA